MCVCSPGKNKPGDTFEKKQQRKQAIKWLLSQRTGYKMDEPGTENSEQPAHSEGWWDLEELLKEQNK